MPQLQPLVLTDRQSTPVNHTFNPEEISGGVASLVESSGVPIGDNRVTMSLRKTEGGNIKANLRFTFPVTATETVNGVDSPKILRVNRAEISFTFSNTSTESERNDIVGMVQDALSESKALTDGLIVDLQGIY